MADLSHTDSQQRHLGTAVWRGFLGHCPHCGEGALFCAYLKVNDHCPHCGEALFHQRADDAPPYVTIVIVGHLLIALYLAAEDYGPPLPAWVHAIGFALIGGILCLLLLPRVKGALIGLQWALRMHGFHGPEAAKMDRL